MLSEFKRFSVLYSSARLFGADSVLRKYLQCPADFPVPISISHGVDAGQGREPYDINSIEPVHWCTNSVVYEMSKKYKPSVLIPHPWVLVYLLLGIDENSAPLDKRNRLIVLPPPGAINDKLVIEWMNRYGHGNDILLVKARGCYPASLEFFRSQGLTALCISSLDESFYFRLYRLLLGCKAVVGLTASSLLFFSASMGVSTTVCDNFFYHGCDVIGWQGTQNYSFPLLRKFITCCLNNDYDNAREIAADVLGEKYFVANPGNRLSSLFPALDSVSIPYYCSGPASRVPRKILELLALASGKPGFLRGSVRSSIQKALLRRVGKDRFVHFCINEIDCVLNGKNESNFSYSFVNGGSPGHGY